MVLKYLEFRTHPIHGAVWLEDAWIDVFEGVDTVFRMEENGQKFELSKSELLLPKVNPKQDPNAPALSVFCYCRGEDEQKARDLLLNSLVETFQDMYMRFRVIEGSMKVLNDGLRAGKEKHSPGSTIVN